MFVAAGITVARFYWRLNPVRIAGGPLSTSAKVPRQGMTMLEIKMMDQNIMMGVKRVYLPRRRRTNFH